jgi:hypothetical protein
MRKKLKRTSTRFFTLCYVVPAVMMFFTGLPAKAQTNEYKIVQSTYYDAITLYYAIKNYKAYPMPMAAFEVSDNEGIAEASTDANSPGFPIGAQPINSGGEVKKYRIIESATGKILLDNCNDSIVNVFFKNPARCEFPTDQEKKSFIYDVLARNANSDNSSEENINKLYKDNVFLKNVTGDSALKYLFTAANFSLQAFQKVSFNKKGGAIPKQIVEGSVDFLIEAVNKEINEAFFVQMEKALSKYDELRILFPKTLESLHKIEVTRYAASLNTMKAAFQEDIRSILSNISKLAELEKYQKLITLYPALTLVFTACDLISLFRTDAIPADIIYQINNAPYITNCASNNFSSVIKLAALLSNSLRDIKINDENKDRIGWVDRPRINLLRDDTAIFQIFMGLFAQQADGIVFKIGKSETFNLQQSLFAERDKVLKGQFIVYNFSESVKKIDEYIQDIKGAKQSASTTSQAVGQYLEVANEIINLAENGLNILPSEKTTAVRKEIKAIETKYLPILRQANNILGNIEVKEYGKALYEADTLLSQVFTRFNIIELQNTLKESADKIKTAVDEISKKSLQDIINTIDSVLELSKSDKFDKIREIYIKYGLFISSVAEAKTSADVKEAIKAIALPTGSSRIKKSRSFSIGLNAYVGVYHAWNKQYNNVKLPKTETGITVPIGFAVNWGHILCGSLTAYGGIVDVGAIFTYKVSTDSSVKSDIQFSQLLSPSVGLIYGLPIIKKYNIPLSIGVNYQWGPKLRKINDAGNSVLPLLAQRMNVFIAVDIPILNFHVSKK